MGDRQYLQEETGRFRPETEWERFEGVEGREEKPGSAGQGYRLINAGMLLGIVLAWAGRFLGIGALSAVHILAAAAVVLLCMLLQRFTAKGRAVCVLLTVVFLGAVAVSMGVERSGLFIRSWIYWLAGQDGWPDEWRVGYEVIQVALAAFVCYVVQSIPERFLVVKVLTADLLVSLLLFCLLTEWEISHTAVAFSLCYIAAAYAEWVQREWDKVKSGDRKRYMLWIMPFIGLYFVLMLCMPTPEQPYEWQFVKKTCLQIGESLAGLTQNILRGGRDDFDTALSGFSGEGTLQEELQENNREVMTVQGTGSLMTNVYLTGRIYDTFDGKGWQQKYHGPDYGMAEDDGQGFWDAVRTREAARLYEEALLRDQLSAATLKIRYRYFRTSCLFVPLKTRDIRMAREREFYVWDGDNLLFRENRGYGTAYEVDYYQINAGADGFDSFLRASMTNSGMENAAGDREIYQIYMEDVALSEETRQYVEELTAGAEDPLESLRRMEAALASFTYTKQPRKMPEEIADAETFLEYFLLEGREGYCTHFATAFVLLARAQGIPARYVQGFCVPMKGAGEASVYSDMAHAWPEVYFEGVGWIPFEPTPGYAGFRYTPWATEEGTAGIAVSYGDSAQKKGGDADRKPAMEEPPATVREAVGTGRGVWRFLAVLGYASSTVCVTGGIILALQWSVRRRRYRRMDVTGKFRMEIAVNLRVLGLLGLRREEGETLQEFRERAVQGDLLRDDGESAESLCTLQCIIDYEEILYGEKAAAQGMLQNVIRERKELLTVLRKRKRWRYVFLRWRLTV